MALIDDTNSMPIPPIPPIPGDIRRSDEIWSAHQMLSRNVKAILVRDAVPNSPDGGEFQFVQVNGQGGSAVRLDKYELTAFLNFLLLTMPEELEDIFNLMGVGVELKYPDFPELPDYE